MLAQADFVIALPLTEQRLRERGYNQAYEWARRVTPKKVANGLLIRLGVGLPQASLSRAERLGNAAQLEAAFQVEPTRYQQVKGQRLVLMDDVQTTGTTLHAAALALLRAGATEVHALVFARAEIN
jgi:predicted amidophosphoribosyltransferase